MKLTFRWYGDSDPVTLEKIRQIPTMSGIVSAVYDVPAGGVWSEESIAELKAKAEAAGLEFEVVESVPVPEDIKLGNEKAPQLIENYCENVRRLGKAGVKVICYNFMPVFDWLRSELTRQNADGSNSLAYDDATVLAMNPLTSELSLPGWDESYTKEGLKDLLNQYKQIDEEALWKNLQTFLQAVIPVAEESGVNTMTVSRAYQQLKAEGYLRTDRRGGSVLTRPDGQPGATAEQRERLRLCLSELRLAGLHKDDILALCAELCGGDDR